MCGGESCSSAKTHFRPKSVEIHTLQPNLSVKQSSCVNTFVANAYGREQRPRGGLVGNWDGLEILSELFAQLEFINIGLI